MPLLKVIKIENKKEISSTLYNVVITLSNVVSFIHFQREEKLDDLNLLFINIHHLINELRPHQVCNMFLFVWLFFFTVTYGDL